MSDNGGEFFTGFMAGALVGAAAALLLTPCSGDEMRKRLEHKGIELKGRAGQWADEARTWAEQAAQESQGRVDQAQERGRIVLTESIKKVQQKVQEAETRLARPGDTLPQSPAAGAQG